MHLLNVIVLTVNLRNMLSTKVFGLAQKSHCLCGQFSLLAARYNSKYGGLLFACSSRRKQKNTRISVRGALRQGNGGQSCKETIGKKVRPESPATSA